MNKHTPGPWHDGLHFQGRLGVQAENGRLVALGGLIGQDDMQIENAANTRLIAAAPDLLAFVERIARLPHHGEYVDLIDEARAAIAKATGDQP